MTDQVNHPSHYQLSGGREVIDFIEHLPFNRGSAIKYLFRAGQKEKSPEVEDLKKARWFIEREIERVERNAAVLSSE